MLKWDCWVSAFAEGPHIDARHNGQRVARVMACRFIASVPVMPHRSGRSRRLYLAIVNRGRGRGWEAVGVYGSANKAKRECSRALEEVAQ